MSKVSITFQPVTIEAIHALRIQVELKEGQNIRASRSVGELVNLLEVASRSANPEVQQAFKKLCTMFSTSHLAYFNSVGLNLNAATPSTRIPSGKKDLSYRGAKTEKPATTIPAAEMIDKKKKIVYRGQEKWV